jgi:DHA1 family bicyclomycin/chloramphenicol resistance-like MFS transporter
VPLTLGFAGFGIAGLLAVLITEKGRMFHAGAGVAAAEGAGVH